MSELYEPLTVDGVAAFSEMIRILVLEPSFNWFDPLRFQFHIISLKDSEGKYEAVSYAWGEPHLEYPLYSRQYIFHITKNLDQALRKFRLKVDKRWLWVDAVCINQQHYHEKSAQIPLMGDIFRGAKRVLAWLGEGGRYEGNALQVLDRWSRIRAPPKECRGQGNTDEYDKFTIGFQSDALMEMDHIVNLLSLPWFSRLWIVQEIVVNVNVLLICGDIELSMMRFQAALRIFTANVGSSNLSRLTLPVKSTLRSLQKIQRLWMDNFQIMQFEPGVETLRRLDRHSLFLLLDDFSFYQCSDARDRVFALVNMATDIHTSTSKDCSNRKHITIPVNYSTGVLGTYRELAYQSTRENWEIIAFASERRQSGTLSWPSWIPDWRIQPPVQPVFLQGLWNSQNGIISTGRYNAWKCSLRIDINPCFTLEHNLLCVDRRSRPDNSLTTDEMCINMLDFYHERGCLRPQYIAHNLAVMIGTMVALHKGFHTLDADDLVKQVDFYLRGRFEQLYPFIRPQHRYYRRQEHDFTTIDTNLCEDAACRALKNWCFFQTNGKKQSFFGLGPQDMAPGDTLVIVEHGTEMPEFQGMIHRPAWVLRPTDDGTCRLVGDSLVWFYRKGGQCNVECKCTLAPDYRSGDALARQVYKEEGWKVGGASVELI